MAGWDERPRGGYSNGDPHEMPADLAAVQADDALLDMIGGGGYIPSDADDELTRVLAEWRREVHAEPVREIVDTTTAMAVIRAAARQPARRRNPVFGSAAAAAAVLVIAFSSVGLVAKSAQPGDHLWGVTQVLYHDYARSVETAAQVRTELNEAKVALNQGNPERARAALQHIQQQLPAVG
ncbi:MAG TPA: anti-sigma-D factor RsdA, partial [Pseudonocardiaceae bacterium]|nr:anti-sigma-D factor RsdA [Pseudonocardiaceae bacterium]